LARFIDHAHPATPDFLEDLVIADAPLGTANVNFFEHVIPAPCTLAIVLKALVEYAT